MSESGYDKHTMVRARSAPLGKKEGMLGFHHGDDDEGEEGATLDLSCPFLVLKENEDFNLEKFREWSRLRSEWVAKSLPNNIIIPDPTPKKIFFDTIKLLAGRTDNLVDELWKYIEKKKLVETAVLLLAAQGEIRGSYCSKRNVNDNQNGFDVIMDHLVEHYVNGEKQLEETRAFKCTYLFVRIISSAGEVLHAYIQHHSEVPHLEVLEHVSSVLMNFGFCPSGEADIDVKNICPYDCKISDRESHQEAIKAITETARAVGEKVVRKTIPRGWDPEYTKRMFFPYWRSVLRARCRLTVYPSYAPAPAPKVDPEVLHHSRNGSMSNGSTQNPNLNLELVGRIHQPASNLQPRRPFGTVAFWGNGFARNPYPNLWLERIRQPSYRQSRRLFGTAAFTLLRLLKSA